MPAPSVSLSPSVSLAPSVGGATSPPTITTIGRSARYTSQGITRCYFLSTISAATYIPTRTDLNGALDLSPEIADWAGWTVTGNTIPVLDLSSSFERQVAGKVTAAQSSITFYADKIGVDIRGVLPRDTPGFIVFMDGGDVPGNKMSIFPVVVIAGSMERYAQGSTADRVTISFAITRLPVEMITVPA